MARTKPSKVRKPQRKAHQDKFLKGLISSGTSGSFNPVGGTSPVEVK